MEIFHWFNENTNISSICFFLSRIEQMRVFCLLPVNSTIHRKTIQQIVASMVYSDLFPRLKILRLSEFPSDSIVESNICQWIDMVVSHPTKNQLSCFRIDFDNQCFELDEFIKNDGLTTLDERHCIVDIYQSSRPGHFELWIERKQR